MRYLQVEAEGTTSAELASVWALIADANRYSQWGPWADGGYRPASDEPSVVGSVQWFRYGRRTMSVERILEVEAPRRLVYTVVDGIPVKNYRAEINLMPTTSNGTAVQWTATWDSTVLGRVVHRRLRQIYPEIVAALIAAMDNSVSASDSGQSLS